MRHNLFSQFVAEGRTRRTLKPDDRHPRAATQQAQSRPLSGRTHSGGHIVSRHFYHYQQNSCQRNFKQQQTRVVAYPDNWNHGDFRNCQIGPKDGDTSGAILSDSGDLQHPNLPENAPCAPIMAFLPRSVIKLFDRG